MLLERSDKQHTQLEDEDPTVPAALTDTGCERELNEDRYAVIESPSGLAWVVCDGMGGEAGGELAAQLALDALRRDLENLPQRPPAVALKGAILEANRVIVLRRQNQAFAGMGTTVVAALFNGTEVALAHAGDSRAYLVRDGAIQQLTTDHTLVQEMVDRGELSAEQSLSHPQAHILTRCIGSAPGLEIDVQRYWIWQVPEGEGQDFLLLCTDGLYSLVNDAEMSQILSQHSAKRACVQLVDLARNRGGYDNITAAIVPLNGQLKNEPPLGYRPPKVAQSARAPDSTGTQTNPLRMVVLVGVLCLLAFLLTVLLGIVGFVYNT